MGMGLPFRLLVWSVNHGRPLYEIHGFVDHGNITHSASHSPRRLSGELQQVLPGV